MAAGEIILAVDPGDRNCGVAVYDGEKLTQAKNLTPKELFEILEQDEFDVILVESFRLFPKMTSHLIFSKMRTVEIIGVVKYIGEKRNKVVTEQPPHIKKLFSDEFLKEVNMWNKNRHVRDAIRHILYFLKFRKGVSHGQMPLWSEKE